LPLLYLATALSYPIYFLSSIFHRFSAGEKENHRCLQKLYFAACLKEYPCRKRSIFLSAAEKKIDYPFCRHKKVLPAFQIPTDRRKSLIFLKAFFAEMNKAIIERNGIINKLMGDGLLAFFR